MDVERLGLEAAPSFAIVRSTGFRRLWEGGGTPRYRLKAVLRTTNAGGVAGALDERCLSPNAVKQSWWAGASRNGWECVSAANIARI